MAMLRKVDRTHLTGIDRHMKASGTCRLAFGLIMVKFGLNVGDALAMIVSRSPRQLWRRGHGVDASNFALQSDLEMFQKRSLPCCPT